MLLEVSLGSEFLYGSLRALGFRFRSYGIGCIGSLGFIRVSGYGFRMFNLKVFEDDNL